MNNFFNKISFLFLLVFISSCMAQENLNLGYKVSEKTESNSKVLIPSGVVVDAVISHYNNCSFTIGMNENKTIVFVSTADPNFVIGGFRVNDDISKIFKNSKMNYIIGWGYYIQIDSDWYAGFDFNSKPTERSKIQWFFKYKFYQGNKKLFKE